MPSLRSLLVPCAAAVLLGAGPADPAAGPRTNAYGMTFIPIPAGAFRMGSPEGEGRAVEFPQHRVHVPAFFLQTTEVTRAQWKAVMGTEPWSLHDLFLRPGDDHAATFVSHQDAEAFVARLNARDPSHVYRLPSEAEWEYAAGAGMPLPQDLGEVAWFGANAFHGGEKYTHRVALKKPNAWGLHDMLGNIWEWVADAWNPDHRGHQGAAPRTTGDTTQRVQKGGSWRTDAGCLRPAARNALPATEFAGDLGFRVVATPARGRS